MHRLLVILVGLVFAGCSAAPQVSARMDDAQVRSVLAAHCPPASTVAQVQSSLDALNVRKGSRILYPTTASRGPVLLVRLFEGRGFWLDSDGSDVKFLDISFAFTPGEQLDRTLLFRDRLRYVQGDPITSPNSPKRPLARPLDRYPAPIPPPMDPLEGAS
jgi:hypothetical protein